MAAALLLFFVFTYLRRCGGYNNSQGRADCPCIDPEELLNATMHSTLCPDPRFPYRGVVRQKSACFPWYYGRFGCAAWDSSVRSLCADEHYHALPGRPSWCADSWCFVSPECTDGAQTVFFSGAALHYSYGTCGSGAANFQIWATSSILTGREVRVYYVHEPPYVDAQHGLGERRGILVDYFYEISQRAKFTIKAYTNGTQESSLNKERSYCIDALRNGSVDICVGNFWVTMDGIERCDWTVPITMNVFHLITNVMTKDLNFSQQLEAPFSPFSWRLWGFIIFMMLVVGAFVYCLEYRTIGGADSAFEIGDGFGNIVTSTYLSCLGFWNAATEHEPRTAGAKIVVVSFAFFIALTMAAYTANLTSSLVSYHQKPGAFTTMHEAMNLRSRFCVFEGMVEIFSRHYPKAVKLLIPVKTERAGYHGVESGKCNAFVNSWQNHQRYMSETNDCTKELLTEDRLVSIPKALPVVDKYQRAMSYWMSVLGENDKYGKYFKSYLPGADCDAKNKGKHEDEMQMSLKDFHGAFVVLFAVIVLAILLEGRDLLDSCKAVRRRASAPDQRSIEETTEFENDVEEIMVSLSRIETRLGTHQHIEYIAPRHHLVRPSCQEEQGNQNASDLVSVQENVCRDVTQSGKICL